MTARTPALLIACAATLSVAAACGSQNIRPASAPATAPPVHAASESPGALTHTGAPQPGPHVLPQVIWRFQTGGRIVATPVELVGGDIVVGSLDGSLYRLHTDGSLVYRLDTGAPIRVRALAIGEDKLFVGNTRGDLVCIDAVGSVLWRAQVPGPIAADPIAGVDHALDVAADGIYAFDVNGNVLWHHVEATTIYDPITRQADGRLVFGTVDGRVVTLDAGGRVLSDVRATPAETLPSRPGATRDTAGVTFAVGPDQILRATRDDGSELWSYSLGVQVSASVLLAASGTLLIGTDDGILYALR